jgi:hypothetical protein
MTTAEAITIAAQVYPKHREPLDKLQGAAIAYQLKAGATALNKRFDGIGGTVADMQKQIDRARAGVKLFAEAMKINLTETMQ